MMYDKCKECVPLLVPAGAAAGSLHAEAGCCRAPAASPSCRASGQRGAGLIWLPAPPGPGWTACALHPRRGLSCIGSSPFQSAAGVPACTINMTTAVLGLLAAKYDLNHAIYKHFGTSTASPIIIQDADQASSGLLIVPANCPTALLIVGLLRTSTLAQAAHSWACRGTSATLTLYQHIVVGMRGTICDRLLKDCSHGIVKHLHVGPGSPQRGVRGAVRDRLLEELTRLLQPAGAPLHQRQRLRQQPVVEMLCPP